MPLVTKEASASAKKIIDHKIKNLPFDNKSYYIKHEEGSNTFKVLEDPQQKDKDGLFEIILNAEKRSRLNNKSKKTELKHIKNQAVQILNDLGEAYAEM